MWFRKKRPEVHQHEWKSTGIRDNAYYWYHDRACECGETDTMEQRKPEWRTSQALGKPGWQVQADYLADKLKGLE